MSYRYLTRSYVEALELPIVVTQRVRSGAMVCGDEGSYGLRPATGRTYMEGTLHAGSLYEREPDGLAFHRVREL